MGVVSSKKKSTSSKSARSAQSQRPQSSNQHSRVDKNEASSVSALSSADSSFLQQPHPLFDRDSGQSFNRNETMPSTATSTRRTSVECRNMENSSSESVHQTNSFYLPDDWYSEDYQYNLHFALKNLFNGNVTPAVAPALKNGAHVIQIGTCSGAWILDMATQYPECEFTGIELETEKVQNLPDLSNIKLERVDALESSLLSFENETVDHVHLRCVGSLVKAHSLSILFAEINRVLKPDGLVRVEEMHHSPTGTVMIECFIETLAEISNDMGHDPEIALKYGSMLQTEGFQVIESRKERIHYASDGNLSREFVSVLLNLYEQKSSVIAPRLGLDLEDYRHRIEQICGECVKVNSFLEWYSWAGRKKASQVLINTEELHSIANNKIIQ
ncbi:S-adenosyl-L-methionine-dependent methyltransferase [Parasitella parasitica]|nr:S-adenosyl-L-methionine-dependent methyltransferase [Parasitella parasitica]